jgi:putative FmdB family regulatory protein
MPTYDYRCKKCGYVYEVIHSILQDTLKKHKCIKCNKEQPCERQIAPNVCPPVFKGSGWTVPLSGFGKRGYKGKNSDQIRPAGTPVDAPSDKGEADRQFQKWVDSGGLQGIKPTVNLNDKNNPARPKTAEERSKK